MFCHACRCHVSPVPPRSTWKMLSVLYWISSLVVAVLFSLIIGLNLVLAPVAIVIGMSVGTSARKLNEWTCPLCDAELGEPSPEEAAAMASSSYGTKGAAPSAASVPARAWLGGERQAGRPRRHLAGLTLRRVGG